MVLGIVSLRLGDYMGDLFSRDPGLTNGYTVAGAGKTYRTIAAQLKRKRAAVPWDCSMPADGSCNVRIFLLWLDAVALPWRGCRSSSCTTTSLKLTGRRCSRGVFFAGVLGDTAGGVMSDRDLRKNGRPEQSAAQPGGIRVSFRWPVMLPILRDAQSFGVAILLEPAFFFRGVHRWADVGDSDGYRSAFFRLASGLMNTGSASGRDYFSVGCRVHRRQDRKLAVAVHG